MGSPYHPGHLAIGFSVWATWFVFLYGGLSVGCQIEVPAEGRGPFTWINGVLIIYTLVVGVGLMMAAEWCRRAVKRLPERSHPLAHDLHGRRMYSRYYIASLSGWLYIAAGISVISVGLPLLVLTPCV